MPDSRQFIDPTQLSPNLMFNVILVNNSQDFISWGIKGDTKANYNHAVTQRTPLMVDSQNLFFQVVPLKNYMIPANMLKIWSINNLTQAEWTMLNDAVTADLFAPWWQRFYNFLGIVGQATKMTWISFPGLYFCSQRVARYLRKLPRFSAVLPQNVSPGFEDAFFIAHPELVTCLGYWWSD